MLFGYFSRRLSWLLPLLSGTALAGHFFEPGQVAFRQDLQVLTDAGRLALPTQTWPISRATLDAKLITVDPSTLTEAESLAYRRLNSKSIEPGRWRFSSRTFIASNPILIRSFEDTPRADAAVGLNARLSTGRFSINIRKNALVESFDQDKFNRDGSYVAANVGNWSLSAGWQERWWGLGWNSSLVPSSNARPSPGVALQRRASVPFESHWFSWIGPWTMTTFINALDDELAVDKALMWGARVGFVPLDSLEIGLSRTAQWCGSGRPCGLDTFADVLLGNDNRGVNVSVEDEPGNQLAGVDLRWRLPRAFPVALYLQWIGEDSHRGGPEIGSWLRMTGAEHWGSIGETSYRLRAEWADTTCREGRAGFSSVIPDYSYRLPIYASGYIYEDRSIGHSADGDSRALSLGATLVQSGDHSWNVSLRRMKINQSGSADQRHTLSATPLELTDLVMTHDRKIRYGRLQFGLSVQEQLSALSSDSMTIGRYLQWSLQ